MKLPSIRRILREDLVRGGSDVPKWIDALLSPLNSFIDQTVLALRNNLTLRDNFACTITTQRLTYDTELVVNPLSANRVTGVLLVDTNSYPVVSWSWKRKIDGSVGLRAKWTDDSGAAPTSADSWYLNNLTFVILLG